MKDGHRIVLSANIELPGEAEQVRYYGAHGVGLFRSEYLFLDKKELPSEEEQAAGYLHAAETLRPDPVVIRTLDVGGDKLLPAAQTPDEVNPFMGWRAIRFCLDRTEIFKTQLRAILRASIHKNVKIMYPMISCHLEVIRANQLLEECKRELEQEGVSFDPHIETGALIEIPGAALIADLIAPHVQFFSLGTNDLVQYTMAVDRLNDHVAHLYQPTHKAVLRLISEVTGAAARFGLPVSLCGEMAADPCLVPLVIGLGVTELSVTPSQAPLVKDVVRGISYKQAAQLAREALELQSPQEILARCEALLKKTAPEILELLK